jgi:hypothetical protein
MTYGANSIIPATSPPLPCTSAYVPTIPAHRINKLLSISPDNLRSPNCRYAVTVCNCTQISVGHYYRSPYIVEATMYCARLQSCPSCRLVAHSCKPYAPTIPAPAHPHKEGQTIITTHLPLPQAIARHSVKGASVSRRLMPVAATIPPPTHFHF